MPDPNRDPIRYQEHAPGPALAALVRCYWTVNGVAPQERRPNRVMPDGCMDVIFDLRPQSERRVYVVGAMLESAVFQHSGTIDFLGVRFVPGAVTLFLDLEADALTARTHTGTDFWPEAGALHDALGEIPPALRLPMLEAFLVRQLNERRRDELALRAMGIIERSRGLLTVGAIRESLGVTERTLQRSFNYAVGLTPKQAIRVARFRHAVALLAGREPPSLARLSVLTGYVDQPHFTRDFHALAGLTPGAYAAERLVGFVQDQDATAD